MVYQTKEVALACQLAKEHGLSQSKWVAGCKVLMGRGHIAPALRNGVLELCYVEPERSYCNGPEWIAMHKEMSGHAQRGSTPQEALAMLHRYLVRGAHEKLAQAMDVEKQL